MKKILPSSKLLILLAGISLLGLLSGCTSFDASRYVQGLLNTMYRDDHRISLELDLASEQEAEEHYQSFLNTQLDTVLQELTGLHVSEEQREAFTDAFEQIHDSVKFTVGEAKKQKDDSYLVPVSCEKMHIIAPALASYQTKIEEQLQSWTEDAIAGDPVPSQEEMTNQLILLLAECLQKSCGSAAYDPAETINVRVYEKNDVYTVSEEDLQTISMALLDMDGTAEDTLTEEASSEEASAEEDAESTVAEETGSEEPAA